MTSSRRLSAVALAAVLFLLSVATRATAQTVYVSFKVNSWTVAPAIMTGQHVKGFLAFADPNSLVGLNMSVIWYQREADGTWTTWGWTDYYLTDAVHYVRDLYNDQTIFDKSPALMIAGCEDPAGNQPKQIINGLFFDDPAQGLVASAEDPEGLVDVLVQVGWQAAADLSPLAVKETVVCDPNQVPKDPVQAMMDQFVYTTGMTLFGSADISLECLPLGCPGCVVTYGGSIPVPGAPWVLFKSMVLEDGSTLCVWDKAATVHYQESGRSYILCFTCNDSGDEAGKIRTTTLSSPGDPVCHEPQ
jgi:hypothetical protein